jgi:HAD superfamily hydrolase (TIGR01450 family)
VSLAAAHDLVIFDLDGVVYLGTAPVPGAPAAIRSIVDGGTPVAFATNNASRRASEVAALLVGLGVPAHAGDVVTSAQAAAELLATDLPAGAPVLPVGAPALRDELVAVGLTPVENADGRPVAVVQGYGPSVGWAQLAEACVAVRAGARWVATNTDATMPSPRGPLPGNGSLVAAVTTALGGRTPDVVVGKPEPVLFQVAAAHRHASRILVVGDRLDTDIEGAQRAGMASLLVLTGVSTPADVLAAPPPQRPSHVAADCSALSTPDEQSRIPAWENGSVTAGGWLVAVKGDDLVLSRIPGEADGDPVAALRGLASAAWAHPQWTVLRPADPAAERALASLALRPREEGPLPIRKRDGSS